MRRRRVSAAQTLVLGSIGVAAACATAEDASDVRSGRSSSAGSSGAIASGGTSGASGASFGGTAGVVGVGGFGGFGGSSAVGGSAGESAQGGSAGNAGDTAAGGSAGTNAGASGAGGSAGSSGVGGSAGTSGSAGQGGASGVGGSAGATSAGGSAGSTGVGGSGGVGGSPPGCDGFLFCDDFEDGNSSGWTESGGDWDVVNDGSFVYRGAGASEESIAGPTLGDQAVEARVKIESFSSMSASNRAGIIARYGGSSSFYTFQIDGTGDLRLLRSTNTVSGTGCAAIADSLATGTWYTLRMEITGPAGNINIKTYLDGVPKHDCTVTGSNAYGTGRAGVITYGTTTASFDDFRVSAP